MEAKKIYNKMMSFYKDEMTKNERLMIICIIIMLIVVIL